MKQKQEEVQQLMEENDSLQKQIQDMMVQDRTEDETTLKVYKILCTSTCMYF